MRRWGVGARVISSAGVGLLLAAGMCGAGRIEDREFTMGFRARLTSLGESQFLRQSSFWWWEW